MSKKMWTGVTSLSAGPHLVVVLDTALLPEDSHTLWNPRLLRAVVDVPAGALQVYCLEDVESLLPLGVEHLYNGWQPWEGNPPEDVQARWASVTLSVCAITLYLELDTDDGYYYSDSLYPHQWRQS